jgi:glucosylceramidase
VHPQNANDKRTTTATCIVLISGALALAACGSTSADDTNNFGAEGGASDGAGAGSDSGRGMVGVDGSREPDSSSTEAGPAQDAEGVDSGAPPADSGAPPDASGPLADSGSAETGAPAAGPAPPAPNTADVWLTTTDMQNLLTKQAAIPLSPAQPGGSTTTLDVDLTQTFQTIDGFGAAMTDSAAYVLTNDLSAAQRQDVMARLFDPVAGIGLSYLRLPMGASDFTSVGSYTYDDVSSGTDPTLAHFSIDHDTAYIIPRLKDALAINPALKIMATPWSPPAWMKSNGSFNGGSLNSSAYAPYAQYFVKFVQAYQAAGLPIDTVTLQNEPQNASGTIPSMSFTASEEADFVASALGPAFAQSGIPTKIVVYDHNWQDQFNGQATTYPQTVYANAQASPYIFGSAFHGYSGDSSAQIAVHDANPDKALYFTEYLAGDGENLAYTFQDILVDKVIGATRNWARTSILWNIVLDQNDGPQNNGCTDCRGVVTVDSSSGAATYNPEYYLLGHVSKFAFGGAKRVTSNTIDGMLTDVAFVNPNGTLALVVMNVGGGAAMFRVRTTAHEFSYSLPAGATATFVWQD